jgi:site-specific DNA-cytosine methylase
MAARLGLRKTRKGLYSVPRRINILEIFCGEKHNAIRALREFCDNPQNLHVVTMGDAESLDVEARCQPAILTHIRAWKPLENFKHGHFDLIWCSIPCPEYSRAKNGRLRNLSEANAVGLAAVKAMFSLEPPFWVIENLTGLLREQA